MKILWITYVMFPEALSLQNGNGQHKGSGGWLFGAAEAFLDNCPDVELTVAIVNRSVVKFDNLKGKRINYYTIPFGDGIDYPTHCFDSYWRQIQSELDPDVVHVHGVESVLGLSYMDACGSKNVVVSIQGLTSIISRFYYHDMSVWDVLKNISFRDLVRMQTLFSYATDFRKRGLIEKRILETAKYVIGRTSWDKAHLWATNPNAKYFFCNETLREPFYKNKWEYKSCTPHTIFLSQATASFKGAHQLVKALPLILRHYPDVQIRIAGNTCAYAKSLKQRMQMTGYELYLKRLVKKMGVQNRITYLGQLSTEQMLDEYLKANVFVCPSTIENSSNSVAESQILGTPLIASYVGGIPDMIPNEACGHLFRVGEYEMLASLICKVFEESKTFDNTQMRQMAHERHNRENNAKRTYQIYKEIAQL